MDFDPFLADEPYSEESEQQAPPAPEDEPPEALARQPAAPLTARPKTVLMKEDSVESVLRDPVRTSSAVLAVVGAAVSFVWVTEMLLLWIPLNLQNPAWTFGTVVETVDLLPSAGVGGALLTFGLVRHPRAPVRIVRRLSTVFFALTALFLLIGYSWVLSIATSFAQAPDIAVQPLRRTVILTLIQLLVAATTCTVMGVILWRGVRKTRRAVRW